MEKTGELCSESDCDSENRVRRVRGGQGGAVLRTEVGEGEVPRGRAWHRWKGNPMLNLILQKYSRYLVRGGHHTPKTQFLSEQGLPINMEVTLTPLSSITIPF